MNTASRLIFTSRCGEAIRVLSCGDRVAIETHVLVDRIEPLLSRAGFVCDLEMGRTQVQALICQLADAIGMAIELSDGPSLAERVAVEGMRRTRVV